MQDRAEHDESAKDAAATFADSFTVEDPSQGSAGEIGLNRLEERATHTARLAEGADPRYSLIGSAMAPITCPT
jgi:hypothetical protein